MSGVKTKLRMTRYSLRQGGGMQLESDRFEVMINPADIKHTARITYDKQKSLGDVKPDPKFSDVGDETLSFSLVLDGTGAVPDAGGGPVSVKDQVADMCKVVYDYVGNTHEPPHVQLLWGSLLFHGRLESMVTQYTLFKPSGEPLRAKVDLAFLGTTTRKESILAANLSSADLSHRVLVREGDTLPLLCERIYGDPGYYLDVARFNDLSTFRRLEPGRQLHFPPLE